MKSDMEIKNKLAEILTGFGIDYKPGEAQLIEVDSLLYMKIIVGIESEFNVTMPDSLLNRAEVKDWDAFVEMASSAIEELKAGN